METSKPSSTPFYQLKDLVFRHLQTELFPVILLPIYDYLCSNTVVRNRPIKHGSVQVNRLWELLEQLFALGTTLITQYHSHWWCIYTLPQDGRLKINGSPCHVDRIRELDLLQLQSTLYDLHWGVCSASDFAHIEDTETPSWRHAWSESSGEMGENSWNNRRERRRHYFWNPLTRTVSWVFPNDLCPLPQTSRSGHSPNISAVVTPPISRMFSTVVARGGCNCSLLSAGCRAWKQFKVLF